MPSASVSAISAGTPSDRRKAVTISCRRRGSRERLRPAAVRKMAWYGEGGHQPGAAQALDRAVDRDVRDAQAPGQIGHAGLPLGRDQFGDHLDIVLGGFARVLPPGAAEPDPVRGEIGHRGLGHRAKDGQFASKGKSVDSGDGICSVGYNLETEPKDSPGLAAPGHTSLEGMHGTVNVPPQSAGFWRQ